jgi:hypothetical protein
VIRDAAVKLPDGRFKISDVMLSEHAKSQDNLDWLPRPVMSSSRIDSYSKAAVMTVLANPRFKNLTVILA